MWGSFAVINQRLFSATASPEPDAVPSGITELVLTHRAPKQHQLLLPMIAHLSKSHQRWLTWLTPSPIDRDLLEEYQVDFQAIRLIHTPENSDNRWILWEALAEGNSHTVIASPGRLSEKDLNQLEAAAHKGGCQGLLLRSR